MTFFEFLDLAHAESLFHVFKFSAQLNNFSPFFIAYIYKVRFPFVSKRECIQ